MQHYQDNLRHIAEPASPAEREDAVSATLEDFAALWFAEVLLDYGHYDAAEPYDDIAVGLHQYIDKKVRVEERRQVPIYVHTDAALQAIETALYEANVPKRPDHVVGLAVSTLRENWGDDE